MFYCKKHIVLVGILLYCISNLLAQSSREYSSKAIKEYAKAMNFIADGNIKEALISLNKTIELEPNYIDAYLSLAGVYGEKKDYLNSVKVFEKAFSIDSSNTKLFLLPYAINLCGLGKFEEAQSSLKSLIQDEYIDEKTKRAALYKLKNCEFALDYKKKHQNINYQFEPKNLGDSVNTIRSEYYPTLSISDSLLVFTRLNNYGEDFIKSDIVNKEFRLAEKVEGSINLQPLKGAATVSSDGAYLIFAADIVNKGYGNYDLYISYNTPDGWSEPENLGDNINSPFWESAPSISPDSRTLYFSSDRPGGFGGRDIYMCNKLPNGRWGNAINLGNVVNTAGNDLYPYIHADNQTLYYTSDGLPGYGNTDLYVTRKIGIDEWRAPENLGYPINTIEDEGSICISSDGLTAYYASDRADSRGGLDLYKFDLRNDIMPFKTLYVKGTVSDIKTKNGIPCNVELIDNSTNKVLMKVTSDEEGKYFMPLPSGKDYTFVVNRKGYLFYSNVYELSKEKSDSTYIKNIQLQPLELNAVKEFNNVQFSSNSTTLLPISLIELDKLVQIMSENATVKLEIVGHTDNIGKPEDNIKLSTARARAVAEYLNNKGIDGRRLSYKGLGSSKPIADNSTEQGRSKNRRTEFVIIGM